jgi:hypothetical protein
MQTLDRNDKGAVDNDISSNITAPCNHADKQS